MASWLWTCVRVSAGALVPRAWQRACFAAQTALHMPTCGVCPCRRFVGYLPSTASKTAENPTNIYLLRAAHFAGEYVFTLNAWTFASSSFATVFTRRCCLIIVKPSKSLATTRIWSFWPQPEPSAVTSTRDASRPAFSAVATGCYSCEWECSWPSWAWVHS